MINILKRLMAWDCRRILCIFGRHVWEREPTLKDPIRYDGNHDCLLVVCGVQVARKKCRLCWSPHPVPYCRKGLVGFGSALSPSSAGVWQEIDSEQEELIKAKPVIT